MQPQSVMLRAAALLALAALAGSLRADDPCDQSFLSNGAPDGVTYYYAGRSEFDPIYEVWTVDDFSVAERVRITEAYWYAVHRQEMEFAERADVIVLHSGDGAPGEAVAELTDVWAMREATGERYYGQLIYLCTAGGFAIEAENGAYFFGVRPVETSEGINSYWLSAPLSGSSTFVKSPYLGVPEWRPWTEVYYDWPEADVAFCLGGFLGEPTTGACCLPAGGACAQRTPDDCSVEGGEFLGLGSSCVPNPCPDAPGACCLPDGRGTCVLATPADCSAAGGEFHGANTRCKPALCPYDDPCQAALYAAGPYDGGRPLYNARFVEDSTYDIEVVVPLVLTREHNTLRELAWYSEDTYPSRDTGVGDYYIFAADGASFAPMTEVVRVHDVPRVRILTGEKLSYGELTINIIENLEIELPAGVFWIGMRNLIHEGDYSAWLTATPRISQGYVRYAFNDPQWKLTEYYLDRAAECVFCVNGDATGEMTGACCLDGACAPRSSAACEAAGGEFGGEETICVPNPCPGAPGACCFDDASCAELVAAECAARGGGYLGDGILCKPGLCPFPDVCINPLHDQLVFDPVTAIWSSREEGGERYSSAVDDFTLTRSATIRGLHWATLDYAGGVPEDAEADVLVLSADCAANAPLQILYESTHALTRRITNQSHKNGGEVYLNSIEGLDIRLPAGRYFLGLQMVVDPQNSSSWLVAPLRNAEVHIERESPWEEVRLWTPSSRVNYGPAYDVSFCVDGEASQAPFGACCSAYGCRTLNREECEAGGGEFGGPETSCSAAPCGSDPLRPLAWVEERTQPGAMYGHSMAYDSVRGVTVLFGYGETWEWDGARWRRWEVVAPASRLYSAMAYDAERRSTVLYGGYLSSDWDTRLGETWTWDGRRWSDMQDNGPGARSSHGMAFDASRNVTVLFGGYGDGGARGDTWEWDGKAWTLRTEEGPPHGSASNVLAYDATRQVSVLVTQSLDEKTLETWEWNGESWTQRATGGPPVRGGSALVYDSHRGVCVLYAGSSAWGPYDDTWEWDGDEWRQANAGPFSRAGHAMAFDSAHGEAVVFGGAYRSGWHQSTFADFYAYDGESWQPRGEPVFASSLTWDDRAATMLLHAAQGYQYANHEIVGLWRMASSGWELLSSEGTDYSSGAAFDSARGVLVAAGIDGRRAPRLFEWNGEQWNQRLALDRGTGAKLAYDSLRQVTVIFGGRASYDNYPSQTVEWNGERLRTYNVAGPAGRVEHAMAYDPLRGVTLLIGGENYEDTTKNAWEWDGETWTEVAADPLDLMRITGMCFDPDLGEIVAVGWNYYDDIVATWSWNGSRWRILTRTNPFLWTSPITFDARRRQVVLAASASEFDPFPRPGLWALAPVAARADANCDGGVDFDDIDLFVAALLDDPLAYADLAGAPTCWQQRSCWGDLDGDGAVALGDIDAFVRTLVIQP